MKTDLSKNYPSTENEFNQNAIYIGLDLCGLFLSWKLPIWNMHSELSAQNEKVKSYFLLAQQQLSAFSWKVAIGSNHFKLFAPNICCFYRFGHLRCKAIVIIIKILVNGVTENFLRISHNGIKFDFPKTFILKRKKMKII